MTHNFFGLGVSATLLELSILAQTILWHYAKPVLWDSFIFSWVGNKQISKWIPKTIEKFLMQLFGIKTN